MKWVTVGADKWTSFRCAGVRDGCVRVSVCEGRVMLGCACHVWVRVSCLRVCVCASVMFTWYVCEYVYQVRGRYFRTYISVNTWCDVCVRVYGLCTFPVFHIFTCNLYSNFAEQVIKTPNVV